MDAFRYNINMSYMYNNKEYVIDSTNITNFVIDYSYDTRNMPILFVTTSIDKKVVDDMIKNSRTKTIILTISKYTKDSSITIQKNYIHDEFMYFLSDDLNNVDDLDYSDSTANSKDIYRKITIGMIDLKLMNNNKKLINEVFINTNLLDIVLKNTSHMNLLIEPIPDLLVPRLIIPPLTSISKYIKFIDSYNSLYPTAYRLFYDFNRTYLLSSAGNNIPAKGENINSIIINVSKSTTADSKVQGMHIDKPGKAYIIELSDTDIKCLEDKATDISYNKIIGIASDGTYRSVDLTLQTPVKNSSEKVRIEMMTNDNIKQVDNIKADILNSSMSLYFAKTELDTSILTLNRKFIVKNYARLYNKDGVFILSSKKEIYTPDNGSFILTTMITLKKAIVS